MTEKEIILFLEKTLDEKTSKNPNYIKYSYFELNAKYDNLSEEDKVVFLKLLRNKLENNGYLVYSMGEKYNYNGQEKIVKENEVLIAINNIDHYINNKSSKKSNRGIINLFKNRKNKEKIDKKYHEKHTLDIKKS